MELEMQSLIRGKTIMRRSRQRVARHRRLIGTVATLAAFAFPAAGQAGVIWGGGFENGTLSQWTNVQQARNGRVAVVRGPARYGRYSVRVTIRPGDRALSADTAKRKNRAELLKRTGERQGTESWWAWSVYFPTAYRPNPGTGFNTFTQWRGGTNGIPPSVSFAVDTGKAPASLELRVAGGSTGNPVKRAWRFARLVKNKWYDLVFHIRWSSTRTGFVELWADGRRVVPRTSMATMYASDNSVYLKQGYYRRDSGYPTVLYLDGTRRLTGRPGSTPTRVRPHKVRPHKVLPQKVRPHKVRPIRLGVSSNLARRRQISGSVLWQASVPRRFRIKRVEFRIDGRLRWTERHRPFVFSGNDGKWDTKDERDGRHVLTVRAVTTSGRVATSRTRITVANG